MTPTTDKSMTLEERCTDIFNDLKKKGRIPADAVEPALVELAASRFEPFMAAAFKEYNQRARALIDVAEEHASLDTVAPMLLKLFTADALEALKPVFLDLIGHVDIMLDEKTPKQQPDKVRALDIAALKLYHCLWEAIPHDEIYRAKLKHLFTPLIKGYCNPPIQRDNRETAIISNTTRVHHIMTITHESGTLFDLDARTPTPAESSPLLNEQTQAFLPELTPDPGALITPMPLYLYDNAGGPTYQRGGGVPVSCRLWIEVATCVPINMRSTPQKVEFALREAIEWIWQNGWSRSRHFPRLQQAMDEVDRMRILVNLPNGGRTAWRVVSFIGIFPSDARLDDKAVARIELPPGSEHGPILHRPTLRRLGLHNAPQFRANLGMAYHWWDQAVNGKYIMPYRHRLVTNEYNMPLNRSGEVIKDETGNPILRLKIGKGNKRRPHPDLVWLSKKNELVPYEHAALERNPAAWGLDGKRGYPIIKDNDLIRLFHPTVGKGNARRVQLSRARDELEKMKTDDLCVIQNIDGGYRIMPPQWWGPRLTR